MWATDSHTNDDAFQTPRKRHGSKEFVVDLLCFAVWMGCSAFGDHIAFVFAVCAQSAFDNLILTFHWMGYFHRVWARICSLKKEVDYYHKEVQENEEKLREMQADTDKYDSYDIKRFQQVLDESHMMIPDSQKRYQQAVDDLQQFVQQLQLQQQQQESSSQNDGEQKTGGVLSGEWYEAAQEFLQQEPAAATEETVVATNVDDLKEGEAFWFIPITLVYSIINNAAKAYRTMNITDISVQTKENIRNEAVSVSIVSHIWAVL